MALTTATVTGRVLSPAMTPHVGENLHLTLHATSALRTSDGDIIAHDSVIPVDGDGTVEFTIPQLPQAGITPGDAQWVLGFPQAWGLDPITFTLTADSHLSEIAGGIYDPPPLPPPPAPSALARWLPAGSDVRFGAYVTSNNIAEVATWNSESGNSLLWDTKIYYLLSNSAIPTAAHAAQAQAGHPIHVPIALKGGTSAVPARGLPAPARTVGSNGIWTYAQITSGAMDGWLTWLGNQILAIQYTSAPILLSLNIEPESVSATTGRRESFSNPMWYVDRATLGDTAVRNILKEYGDAFRYFRAYLEAMGVDAVFFLNHGALAYTGSWHNTNVYPAMYPGDDVVDVIGWDPYVNLNNDGVLVESLASKLATTLSWLSGGGFDTAFFRTGTGAKTKPRMLPEYGCSPGTTTATYNQAIAWLGNVPGDLAGTGIRGICYYSADGTELTKIDTIPTVRQAFADMSDNSLFQP